MRASMSAIARISPASISRKPFGSWASGRCSFCGLAMSTGCLGRPVFALRCGLIPKTPFEGKARECHRACPSVLPVQETAAGAPLPTGLHRQPEPGNLQRDVAERLAQLIARVRVVEVLVRAGALAQGLDRQLVPAE